MVVELTHKGLPPTAQESIFFNPAERFVMSNKALLDALEQCRLWIPSGTSGNVTDRHVIALSHYGDWLFAKSDSQKKTQQDNLFRYCEDNYPQGYAAVKEVLVWQENSSISIAPKGISELVRKIEWEFDPPKFLNLRFRFQIHYVKSVEHFEELKRNLKEEMKKVFKLGEKNVYFGEDADGLTPTGKEFKGLFKLIRSYSKVIIFRSLATKLNRKPTNEELEKELTIRKKRIMNSGSYDEKYALLEEEAVDELIQDGYDIDIEHEKKSVSDEDLVRVRQTSDQFSLDEYKKKYLLLRRLSLTREVQIAKQVDELARNADKVKTPTNVFILLGSRHEQILKRLKKKLLPVTSFSKEELTSKFLYQSKLAEVIIAGQEPPDELWEKAYEEGLQNREFI